MIDEADVVWICGGIQRQVIIQLNQVDDFLVSDQFAGFPQGNDHTPQIADLFSGGDALPGVSTLARDAAFGYSKRVQDPVIGRGDQAFFFFNWNIRERLNPIRSSPFPHWPVVSVMKARSFIPVALEICN